MEPKQLSQELRQGKNPDMTRRRAIIGLSMLGSSMGQIVTLYQTGIVSHSRACLYITKSDGRNWIRTSDLYDVNVAS